MSLLDRLPVMSPNDLLSMVKAEKISVRRTCVPITSYGLVPRKSPYTKINKCYPYPSSLSQGEEACKAALELIYGKPFIHCRPCEFHGLELDLFNRKLGIACEYHGKQHYVFPSRFIKRKKDFVEQIRRDLIKRALCERLGILLIVVPYTVPIQEIRTYIESALEQSLNEWEQM